MFGVNGGGIAFWLGENGVAHLLGSAAFTLVRNLASHRVCGVTQAHLCSSECESFPCAWWSVDLVLRGSVSLLSNPMSKGPSLISLMFCSFDHKDE